MNRFTLLLALYLVPAFAYSQTDGRKLKTTPRSGLTLVPNLNYAPETGFLLGAGGLKFFHLDSLVYETDRPSNIFGAFNATTRGQYTLLANYDLYFKNMTYFLFGGLTVEKNPFVFYGIGNSTASTDAENYTPFNVRFETNFLKNIHPAAIGQGFSAGIRGEFLDVQMLSTERGKRLSNQSVIGSDGGKTLGIGAIANYDTRNNIFSATDGMLLETRATFYSKAFVSDFSYSALQVDFRKFVPLFNTNTTLAFQTVGSVVYGDAPFYQLPTFGGSKAMRGIFFGQFRDKASLMTQMEIRFALRKEISLVAFTGAGQVAPAVNKFSANEFKVASGVGVRWYIRPDDRIALRLDYGTAQTGEQIYLSFLEAF
jgi:outer membrane protein assembly factor BamA